MATNACARCGVWSEGECPRTDTDRFIHPSQPNTDPRGEPLFVEMDATLDERLLAALVAKGIL